MNYQKCISVCDTGAVIGAEELQTEAFQTAIDRMFSAGGGTVTVPSGTFHIGGIRLRSNVTLKLLSGARIIGSRDMNDYDIPIRDTLEPLPEEYRTDAPFDSQGIGKMSCDCIVLSGSRWNRGLIYAFGAENISVIAEPDVIIDGDNSYDPLGEQSYRGAHGISFQHCSNINLYGYTIQNTGNFAHNLKFCKNISVQRVTVYGGHDGVHTTNSHNIEISKCRFYTGDDCVAGLANINTTVTECVMNTACSGLRFGGMNVLVKNCVFYGPSEYGIRLTLTDEQKKSGMTKQDNQRKNMLSVFTYVANFNVNNPYGGGNILITDCTARNVDRLMQYNFFGSDRWQTNNPLSSVTFKNVRAEDILHPLYAYGSKEVPVSLTLDKVRVSFRKDANPSAFINAGKFERITLDDVAVTNLGDAPLVKCFGKSGEVILKELHGIKDKDGAVEITDEAWHCASI